jgi:hypothetical protein
MRGTKNLAELSARDEVATMGYLWIILVEEKHSGLSRAVLGSQ